MSLNADLLRTSFVTALERNPLFTGRFYGALKERHPEAAHLFKGTDMDAQHRAFAAGLNTVLMSLENTEQLKRYLGALGRRHVGYGVTPEMYAWAGDALIETLRDSLGDGWTDEHAVAWQEAYSVIQTIMKAGADLATPANPTAAARRRV